MTPEAIIVVGQNALLVLTILLLMLLVPALIVGVLISMFQAATQINEMTLTFIPKLLTLVLALLIAGPWMLELIQSYTISLFNSIPDMLG